MDILYKHFRFVFNTVFSFSVGNALCSIIVKYQSLANNILLPYFAFYYPVQLLNLLLITVNL